MPHPTHSDTTSQLVTVAYVRDEVEAEVVQGLLRQVGVASLVRRPRGFDVPDFLTAGPRDVLVAARDLPSAQQVLVGRGRSRCWRPGGITPVARPRRAAHRRRA